MERLTKFFSSLRTAADGVMLVVRIERNARIHLLVAVLVLLLGIWFGISDGELAAVFFAIILVFTAEIVNTALEKTLDLIQPNHSEQVRVIKDIAAGAVLVSAVGAAAIGVAIFGPYVMKAL